MNVRLPFLFFFTSILLAGCNNTNPSKSNVTEYEPNYSTPQFIIDDHLHARVTPEWEQSFIEVYTRHNAMACCFYKMEDWEAGIAFARVHPDRVIPYATVDIDSPGVLEEVQKAYDMGFKGLGELFARGPELPRSQV